MHDFMNPNANQCIIIKEGKLVMTEIDETSNWSVKENSSYKSKNETQLLNNNSNNTLVDNHSSGYLGMAVQHCVRAYLGPHCILAQKQYCQKLRAQLNSTALYVYFEAINLFMKNSVTVL